MGKNKLQNGYDWYDTAYVKILKDMPHSVYGYTSVKVKAQKHG